MKDCERGVYRHELFDGTAEYHLVDSHGPVAIVQVAQRVPRDVLESRLCEFLSMVDPEDGTTAPVLREPPQLRVLRVA